MITVLLAGVRLWAVSATIWDWDEALFVLGMRDYDVGAHHPHPPGFPVYIFLARTVRCLVGSDVAALQIVVVAFAIALFPVMVMLVRTLGFERETALLASTIYCTLPNTVFFAGTAFSDIPAICTAMLATALLLRGTVDSRRYLIGTALLAISLGIRPQNLLIGFWGGVRATLSRMKGKPLIPACALAIGASVTLLIYFLAAHATGSWQRYWDAVAFHTQYISSVDSLHNPERQSLWKLAPKFAIFPFTAGSVPIVLAALATIGLVEAVARRRNNLTHAVLTFIPMFLLALLFLDPFGIARFSLAYLPLTAILSAHGLRTIAGAISRRSHVSATLLSATFAALLTAAMLWWVAPAISLVRKTDAPPVAAVRWIRSTFRPGDIELYASAPTMTPFAELFLHDFRPLMVQHEGEIPPRTLGSKPAFYLSEGIDEAALIFRRDDRKLKKIVRRRFFSVSIKSLNDSIRFEDGWYAPEDNARNQWRWMAAQSIMRLPIKSQQTPGMLHLSFDLPDALAGDPPFIEIEVGGLTDRFRPAGKRFDRSYRTTLNTRVIRVSTSTAVAATGTPTGRIQGLSLDSASWVPVGGPIDIGQRSDTSNPERRP